MDPCHDRPQNSFSTPHAINPAFSGGDSGGKHRQDGTEENDDPFPGICAQCSRRLRNGAMPYLHVL
jgi:hypothetical protein